MTRVKISSKVLSVLCCCGLGLSAAAQAVPGENTFGISATFAPDSSHILIGSAEQRQTWTVGFEYDRTLWSNQSLSVDYEGVISPFFEEKDPTVIGSTATLADGSVIATSFTPERVTYVNAAPIGEILGAGPPAFAYPVYGSQKTYALALSPIGARIKLLKAHRLQPIFSADLGFVWSSRDLPIDNSARFNYLISIGPGLEYRFARDQGVRLEYVYRHMSNADSGTYNPGVDQGTIRMTVTFRRAARSK